MLEPLTTPIQQIQENTGSLLYFEALCKGIFVEGEHLNKVELFINNSLRFRYDSIMLKLCSKKITNNLIYIPFSHTEWTSRELSSFEGGIHFSRLDSASIMAYFNDVLDHNVKTYALTHNVIKYKSGMGIIQYMVPFKTRGVPVRLPVRRIVSPDKSFCVISQKNIEEHEEYQECNNCKNCFNSAVMNAYLANPTFGRKCPLCQHVWNNNNAVYVNERIIE